MRFQADSPAYKQAQALAQGVFNGTIQDQTNGATHFFAPAAQASLGRSAPGWASGDPTASIGGLDLDDGFALLDERPSFSIAGPAAGSSWNC